MVIKEFISIKHNPIKIKLAVFFLIIISNFYLPSIVISVFADTIYLKNGRSIEGIINKDDPARVSLDVGFGEVVFEKNNIERIDKTTAEQSGLIRKKWKEDKIKAEALRLEKEAKPKDTEFLEKKGHIIVEALLNNRVKATLLLDTGASVVVLPVSIANKLGINFEKEKATAQLVLADGRKLQAKYVTLGDISIEDAQAKNVGAAIIPDSAADIGIGDGILGMSFLNQFNFKVDYNKNKLILEKR